jgi:DNA-binding GntR family transcriptional regulator
VDRAIFFCKYERTEDAIEESKAFYQQVYNFCPFIRVKKFLYDMESYLEIIRRYDYAEEGYTSRACKSLQLIISGIKEKDGQKIRKGLYSRDSMILNSLYKHIEF